MHGKVLHCDERMLDGLGGCGTVSRVKVQQMGQQLHKVQHVQLVLDAQFIAMVTIVGIGNTPH